MAELNLMAVVRLSGLSEHVLRAWEKRYQAVTPKRAPNGRRMYTLEDLEKLKLLSLLVRRGYAIRNVANLDLESLKKLHQDLTPAPAPDQPNETNTLPHIVQKLIENLRSFDLTTLDQNLRVARFQYSPKTFVLEIAAPLMAEIGVQVADDRMSVAQEHALSAIIRDHLGEIYRSVQTRIDADHSVVLCTPEGDLHEFGILLSGVLFASAGWKTYYLGPNLPARDLIKAAQVIRPKVIVIGCSPLEPSDRKKPLSAYLNQIDESLPPFELWLGGGGIPASWTPGSGRPFQRIFSLRDLAQTLGV